jgi:putative redox protein
MAVTMTAEASWREGLQFNIQTGTGHGVAVDGDPEHGGGEQGPRPMELLLVGTAGCAAMDLISILKKMRQDVKSYTVKITGERRDEQPQVFTHIVIEHIVEGNVEEAKLAHAIELSDNKYCSAQAMMRGVAKVETRYTIV